jgi:branched-subunit amino acid aminotransferase/4-amino-4-deoxychorismate lyase
MVFFESILYIGDRFPFLNLHLERILELAHVLHIEFTIKLDELDIRLREAIHDSSERKFRLKFKIHEDNLHIDTIESQLTHPYSFQNYPSISLVIYPHYTKPQETLSRWKYENHHLYQDSIEFAHQSGAFQSIILNEKRDIVETSLSNFFYFIDNKLYTPPLSSGAVNGVFRRYLMSKYNIIEKKLHWDDLKLIEEVFISSAIRGIVPVKKIDDFTYPTIQSDQMKIDLIQTLNFLK